MKVMLHSASSMSLKMIYGGLEQLLILNIQIKFDL